MNKSLGSEVSRRRTFAIISHPDAGKTTLTEKLLLYGGAIHLAGTVKARKSARHATSDWMEIEKQRGISVTSSVLQFEYNGFCINILDTPGHQDFSEDTYRTLHAADSAVMLIDGAKGVEEQTIKLFTVCRQRGIPIFTFVNKMDRASKDPFALMDELEKVLGIRSVPINWPIGTEGDFKGVYNRKLNRIELFDSKNKDHGASMVKINITGVDDSNLADLIGSHHQEQLMTDIELLNIAGDDLDIERVLKGELTPVFFGSALSNFGVEPFLNEFLAMAPPPQPHLSTEGLIRPDEPFFSGFVFKIQANMNPDHHDRIAFVRICSGRFEKGMEVWHPRLNKTVRLAQPQQFLAQDRNIVEEAYAGDIIGLFDPGLFRISDTLVEGNRNISYEKIPIFPPEHFAQVSPTNSMKRKQFLRGIEQLAEEGAVQLYKEPDIGTETYIVGVVGILQLDVLIHRLETEYGVSVRIKKLPDRFARWILPDAEGSYPDPEKLNLASSTRVVLDQEGRTVLLFESDWAIRWALERNPGLKLASIYEVSSI